MTAIGLSIHLYTIWAKSFNLYSAHNYIVGEGQERLPFPRAHYSRDLIIHRIFRIKSLFVVELSRVDGEKKRKKKPTYKSPEIYQLLYFLPFQ